MHQGLALEVEPLEPADLDDVLRAVDGVSRAIVVVLDQVSDPQNIGAILRAAAFGALGVVVAVHGALRRAGRSPRRRRARSTWCR